MSIPSLPAETVTISPEYLEVANAYMVTQDIEKVAHQLEVTPDFVSGILDRREVQSYMNRIFLDVGYNNRVKMRELLDSIIQKKIEEMTEADIGSGKDIIEILAMSHKFTMEHLDREIALKKLEQGKPNNQFNVQINNDSSNYAKLLDKLINNTTMGT